MNARRSFRIAMLGAMLALAGCMQSPPPVPEPSPLAGRVIALDPGHGGTAATDQYRKGPTGEREEWINLRVAQELKQLLEAAGARVLMTREDDVFVPLDERGEVAERGHAVRGGPPAPHGRGHHGRAVFQVGGPLGTGCGRVQHVGQPRVHGLNGAFQVRAIRFRECELPLRNEVAKVRDHVICAGQVGHGVSPPPEG